MIMHLTIVGIEYIINSEQAISIAIPLKFDGLQPNHFGAEVARKQAIQSSDFIGDTKRGGSCNVDSITLVPHCNGTHTESIAHIIHQKVAIGNNLTNSLSICQVISVTPVNASQTVDSYLPDLAHSDQVIDLNCLKSQLNNKQLNQLESLVIRTQVNHVSKLSCVYDENNQPPFFTHQAISWLAQSGIKHLLVDMPSIDKMYDDGQLSNHHIYWNVAPNSRLLNDDSAIERTITEMIYVDDTIQDGMYCLNLQMPALELDAVPSRPILYPLKQYSHNNNPKSR